MARVVITPQTINKNAGATVTFANADFTNGMKFLNDGATELLINNGGDAPCAVTVAGVPDPYGRTGNLTLSVAAGAIASIPVLDPILFNQTASDIGSVHVDMDESTDVTIAAVRRG